MYHNPFLVRVLLYQFQLHKAKFILGPASGSNGKGTSHHIWQPEFDPHLESTSWKERTDSDKLSYDLYT